MTNNAFRDVSDMTLSTAKRILDFVFQEAGKRELKLACAVCDRAGNLVLSGRMDDSQLGGLPLAVDKAFTSVAFGHPTSKWASLSTPGESDWGLSNSLGGRVTVFPGGLPIFFQGQLVGGVGVSGAASLADEEVASLAIASLSLEDN